MTTENQEPRQLTARCPPKLKPIIKQRARYKAAHGGRGGGKSHAFALAVVVKVMQEGCRVVCLREVQNSIKESVRQLIVDKISELGVEDCWEILDQELRCKNGGLVIFKGLQSYNAHNIKSLENFSVAWVEEAQSVSELSWRMLTPDHSCTSIGDLGQLEPEARHRRGRSVLSRCEPARRLDHRRNQLG